MSRVPLNNYNLTSLAEDFRVLRLLPEEAEPLSEAKAGKKKKDYEGDYEGDYDYGDKMKKMKEEDDIEEAAGAVLDAFFELSEDEIDLLDDSYLEAVEEAAEVLGVDLEEKFLSKAERVALAKNRKVQTAAEKKRNREAKKYRRRNKAKLARQARKRRKDPRVKRREKMLQKTRQEDVDLDNIIERLQNLTAPLTQESDEVGEISDKIVEGLKGVFYSSNELAQRAALELAEDDFDQDDPRYQLGVFFESIASDARRLLDSIFEGEDIPMEDAIEDLQALSSDLKKGLRKAERIA